MPAAPLLLLTGSPGCGKTTVAPLVADRHEPSACLGLDWFFAKLRRGAVEPWRAEAHEQNRTCARAAAAAVAAAFAGGRLVHRGGRHRLPVHARPVRGRLRAARRRVHYAVLRAPVGVVQQRVRGPHEPSRSTPARWPTPAWSTTCGPSSSSHGVDGAPPGRRRPGARRTRWPRRSTAGCGPATARAERLGPPRTAGRPAAAWSCGARGPCRTAGSTCLPKVSTASWHASIGMEVDSMPKDSWSAPVAAKFSIVLPPRRGCPRRRRPRSMAASSVVGVHGGDESRATPGCPAGGGTCRGSGRRGSGGSSSPPRGRSCGPWPRPPCRSSGS